MDITAFKLKKVGDIVSEDYRTAGVFRSHGIDFCCGGDQSVGTACKKKGIDPASLNDAILSVMSADEESMHAFDKMPVDELIAYIMKKHHDYIREKVPQIMMYATRTSTVHATELPETVVIYQNFKALAEELEMHLRKEEMILFPYARQLSQMVETGRQVNQKPPFGSAKNPIQVMEHEHDVAQSFLANIKEASRNYSAHDGACSTFQMYFGMLKEFHLKLEEHMHLENNILFPKCMEMEEKVIV